MCVGRVFIQMDGDFYFSKCYALPEENPVPLLVGTYYTNVLEQLAQKRSCMFQINLRLILVSGKTKEYLFSPSDSAGDIAQHVFDNWPEGNYCSLTSLCSFKQAMALFIQ